MAVVLLVTGCASMSSTREKLTGRQFDDPVVEQNLYLKKESTAIAPPAGGPITVAVYGFQDKTGQRKQQPLIASLSSAVTQGAESYLIKALQDVGEQRWFTVVERVGLDNLIKERQMIRQMREAYQGREAKPLPPMMFAGIIMEGGIIGYDSNTITGGSGLRIFGIGASTQYQADTVTVNLRTVSVSTGEVLTSVTVTKTVLSYMDKVTLLRFFDDGTNSVEGEIGGSINESINKATSLAVQAAVIDTIKDGARKGHWAFKEEPKNVERTIEVTPVKAPEPAVTVAEASPKEIAKNPINPVATVRGPPPEGNKPSSGRVYLKDLSYVYKEANDRSTKSWQLVAGVELTIIDEDGPWVKIKDSQNHSGWILKTGVVEK